MQHRSRGFALLATLFVIALVTMSCAPPAAPAAGGPAAAPPAQAFVMDIPPRADGEMAPDDQQVLRWDLPGDFWPDPLGIGGWWGDSHPLTSAGLTTETIDGAIRGELAETWDVSEDGLTYTFHLNPNAKFSDGSPITAEDVEFSLVSLLDPNGPADALYRSPYYAIAGYKEFTDGSADNISGIQVIDEHTIAITLTIPQVFFPATLGFWQARIVSKKNVTEGGEEWWRTPVTSGMFKITRFDFGESNHIELEPNEHYVLGPQPKIKRIIVERVTDPSTRLTRYLNNETNVLYYPEPADVAAALRGGELKDELLGNVIAGTFFFYFRHDRPPFDDLKVRQAFIMALDRDKLSRSVLEGTLFPLDSLIPRGTACYDAAAKNQLPYDPNRARQLLAESQYASNLPQVRIQVSEVLGAPTIGRWTRVATAMAAMWQEEFNISVQLQTKEFEFEDKKEGAAQVFRSSRSPLVLDGAALSLWFGEGQSTAGMLQYKNPQVEQLLAQADIEKDAAKRCEMYQQADKMLLEDGVFAAAWGIANWAFAKPEIRGISTQTRWQFYLSIPQTYVAVQ
jgi:ABC-type oligopeptide transport system substrate-binding subunit